MKSPLNIAPAEKIIQDINDSKKNDYYELYANPDSIDRIINHISIYPNDKGGWNALRKLYQEYDGEYAPLTEYTIWKLADSNIPKDKWIKFIKKDGYSFKDYDDIKNYMVNIYANELNKPAFLIQIEYPNTSPTELQLKEQSKQNEERRKFSEQVIRTFSR